jgi:hypothetical protein
MPFRSTRITLQNETGSTLTLINSGVDGQWTDGGWNPPSTIAPHSTGACQSESTGPFTDRNGTQGFVVYGIDESSQRVSISWGNPAVGVNTYEPMSLL